MEIRDVVENGLVYEVISEGSWSQKTIKGTEYSLIVDADVTVSGDIVNVSGICYKKDYKDNVHSITDPITVRIGDNPLNTVTLNPVDGYIQFDIDITSDVNVRVIEFVESETVYGYLELKLEG